VKYIIQFHQPLIYFVAICAPSAILDLIESNFLTISMLTLTTSAHTVIHSMCGEKCWHETCCTLLGEYNSERLLEIGQHLPQLWTNV